MSTEVRTPDVTGVLWRLLLFSVALLQAWHHVLFISLSLPCSSRRALWHRPWLWRLRSRPLWLWPPRPRPSLPPSQYSLSRQASPRPPELLSCPRSVPSAPFLLHHHHSYSNLKGASSVTAARRLAVSHIQPRNPSLTTSHSWSRTKRLTHAHACSHSCIHTSTYQSKDIQPHRPIMCSCECRFRNVKVYICSHRQTGSHT